MVRVFWDKISKMWCVARYSPTEFIWRVDTCHATEAEARSAAEDAP